MWAYHLHSNSKKLGDAVSLRACLFADVYLTVNEIHTCHVCAASTAVPMY